MCTGRSRGRCRHKQLLRLVQLLLLVLLVMRSGLVVCSRVAADKQRLLLEVLAVIRPVLQQMVRSELQPFRAVQQPG